MIKINILNPKQEIYDIDRKENISVRTAENRGIRKNSGKFILPKNLVLIPNGRRLKFVTTVKARELINKEQLKVHKVIGNFELNTRGKIIQYRGMGKKEKKEVRKTKVIRHVLTEGDIRSVYALRDFLINNNISGKGKIIFGRNGRVLESEDLNITKPFNKWWKRNGGIFIFMTTSDSHVWTTYDVINKFGYIDEPSSLFKKSKKGVKYYGDIKEEGEMVFLWSPDEKIDADKIYQTFRDDGDNMCFFKPIERYIDEKKQTKNIETLRRKLNKWKDTYPNGVEQGDIQMISDDLKIRFQINDIFNKKYLDVKPSKRSITTIKYINSNLNHLDENHYADNLNNEIEITSVKEMCKILNDKIDKNDYFYYLGNSLEPSMIYTEEGTYVLKSELKETIKDFNKRNNIMDFKIDAIKDNKKFKFIRRGVNYNAHCLFNRIENPDEIENDPDYHEYDMKKAYTQYKKCKFYVGFPTHLTPEIKLKNWSVSKCVGKVGFYKVIISKINDDNKKLILNKLGLYEGKYYTLTTPEIMMFDKHSVEFTFISGSYCFKSFHFDIDDDMKKTVEGQKPYAIWAGKLNSVSFQSVLKTFCCKSLAGNMASTYDNVEINDYSENMGKVECKISYDKTSVNYNGAIGGFITAYTRCNVLPVLLDVEFDRIVGYKLDGFIVRDELKLNSDMWIEKDVKCTFAWGDVIFNELEEEKEMYFEEEENEIDIDEINTFEEYEKELFKKRVTVLTGAGGTGKSHSVLSKMKDTMYLSACWRLNVDKMGEYDINGLSIHQFLGLNCESYLTRNPAPARIFIDEITQIDKKHIQSIIKKCPYSQIFIAGDVDKYGYYQCSFKDVQVINDFKGFQIIKFKKNYRCKDDVLLKKLNKLRKVMKTSKFNNNSIMNFVKKEFKDRYIKEDFLKETYDYKNDWVLCSTTNGDESQTKYYTELLKGDKYLCVKHSKNEIYTKLNGGNACLQGEIIHDLEKISKRFEKRHGFTIHSFQGITIKNPQRLFIDTNKIFTPRQLYTALSRVEHLGQIFLI